MSVVLQQTKNMSKQAFYEYFFETVNKTKDHIYDSKLYNIQDPIYIDLVKTLKKITVKLCAKYGHDSENEKAAFVNRNLNTLYKIYDAFFSDYAKAHLLVYEELDAIRSIIDRFYRQLCNITKVAQHFNGIPTSLFQEFIRGITHFANDTVYTRPSYHRSGSCGPADTDHLKRLMGRENRPALVKCYIERFIYDQIYTRVLHRQDVRHLYELKTLEIMLSEFTDFRIALHYDGIIPIRLSIKASTLNQIPLYKEDYRKFANGRVLAVRTENISREGIEQRYKYKVQNFDVKHDWSSVMQPGEEPIFEHLIRDSPPLASRVWSQPRHWVGERPVASGAKTRRIRT